MAFGEAEFVQSSPTFNFKTLAKFSPAFPPMCLKTHLAEGIISEMQTFCKLFVTFELA